MRTEVLNHGFDLNQYHDRITQYLNDAQGLVCRRVDYYLDEATLAIPTVAGTARECKRYHMPRAAPRQPALSPADYHRMLW